MIEYSMTHRTKSRRRDANTATAKENARKTAAGSQRTWGARLRSNLGFVLFFVAACLVCLGYTLYTNQIWEDSLIALRQCENFIKGEGLTYNAGTRLQSFSSPLNVLLLTISSFLAGVGNYLHTFWLY